MRAKEYQLLADCVERGLEAGWHRAHKHTDKPAPADVWTVQHNAEVTGGPLAARPVD